MSLQLVSRDAMMSSNQYYEVATHGAGYSSDSSVMSHDRGRYMKRLDRPRWWTGWSSVSHTSNETLESLCHQCRSTKAFSRLSIMPSRIDDGRITPYFRQVERKLWVTEVISGTGFYALTERSMEKAAEISALMANEIAESYKQVNNVMPKKVCAMKINDNWERLLVKIHCGASSCPLRMEGDEQQYPQNEFWHVSMMEAGTILCVPLSRLVVVTREITSESPLAKLYFLRRVHLKDDETISTEAKVWLKNKIQINRFLSADVYYRTTGKGKTQVEMVVDGENVSDGLVEAGFGIYNYKPEQKDKVSESAVCCSLQDIVSASSRDSITSHTTARCLKNDSSYSSMPELMEIIDHLMKKRKENVFLTFSGSALNLAIKAHGKELHRHQRLCEHSHAALNKQQILLRRLRDENPHLYETRDVKDNLYEDLIEMFEKWKANYKSAQRKADSAIDIITNIFLAFSNKNSGLMKYRCKCRKLEAALINEELLQNEGQDLAHMVVPAVGAKLRSFIDKLENMASGYVSNPIDRPQTLLEFITNSKYITPLTLETLAKDILDGLYHFHKRGVAYKHLHPENVVIRNGHAALRPVVEQKDCKIGEDWPFEGVEVANEDLGKPGDVFNFGLLILWMACKGADNYYAANMKFYCNMALIKMTMAEDPSQRPQVESMVCTNSTIFRPNSQWRSMPLKDYLREVFKEKYNAESIDEETGELPSEMETGESTSEAESFFHQRTEDESGAETTESEVPKDEYPIQYSVQETEVLSSDRDLTTPNTDIEQA